MAVQGEEGAATLEYGPFLITAVICERVLEEKDGVKSVIRIIDQLTHTVGGPNPPEKMDPFDYELSIMLSFKPGQARGSYRAELAPVKPAPDTEPLPSLQVPMNFTGPDERGIDIVGRYRFRIDRPGLWWFDVYLSGERIERQRVTRIPFRVFYAPQPIMRPGHQ
jgi:hypothetical protein